ncbi:hypothetical protein [Streptomyces sp. NPDC047725]|uniref:hypothetical protein n=1 Tax=Streptomyces sp. NPDC047725 TaxID=3365487 RepID=UPI003712D5AB
MPQDPGLGPHHQPPLPLVQMREQHLEPHCELATNLIGDAHTTTTSGITGSNTLILCEPLVIENPSPVLSRTDLMSAERRAYLVERWKHWRQVALSEHAYFMPVGREQPPEAGCLNSSWTALSMRSCSSPVQSFGSSCGNIEHHEAALLALAGDDPFAMLPRCPQVPLAL